MLELKLVLLRPFLKKRKAKDFWYFVGLHQSTDCFWFPILSKVTFAKQVSGFGFSILWLKMMSNPRTEPSFEKVQNPVFEKVQFLKKWGGKS